MSLLAQPVYAPSFRKPVHHFLIGVIIATLCICALVFTSFDPSTAFGATKNDSLKKAKATVVQAQKAANAAATAYANAESALGKVTDRLSEVHSQLENAEATVSTLQVKASNQAKDAYIRTSSESSMDSPRDVVDEKRRTQLLATVSEFDDSQLTHLVGLKEDLKIAQDELSQLQEDRRNTLNDLSAQKKALAAKLIAASKAQKSLEKKLARQAKAKATTFKGSGKAGQILYKGTGPMACPVAGAVAFTDTWGQPRSGGRTHKGTDMFAARGTPNVAIVDGQVRFTTDRLGGISAYVDGNNGVQYYYTHLNSTVGGARSVKRGELIGYVGNTGNARGGATHTHFEIHPNGTKVNPYPTLRSIC